MRLGQIYANRTEIVTPVVRELRDDFIGKQTPVTTAEAYLKMHEELRGAGVSERDVFTFFKQCLSFNITLSQYRLQMSDKLDTSGGIITIYKKAKQDISSYEAEESKRRFSNVPHWFKGSVGDWVVFAVKYADFAHFLDTDGMGEQIDKKIRAGDVQSMRDSVSASRNTFRDFLPDWLIDSNGVPPDIEEVKRELAEDKVALVEAEEHFTSISGRIDDLYFGNARKTMGTVAWTERNYRRLFPQIGSFAELLVYLNTTDACNRTFASMEVIENTPYERWRTMITPAQQVFEMAVGSFVNSDAMFSTPDLTAIYLENVLRTSTLVTNASQQRGSTIVPVLDAVLGGGIFDTSGLPRSTETKIKSVINKTLAPLARILTDDGKEYLQEYLPSIEDGPASEVIWELADAISQAANRRGSEKDVAKAVDDIRRRSANWIRANWRGAYTYLREKLVAVDSSTRTEPDVSPQSVLEEPYDMEEAGQLERQFITGNLDGWTLRYSQNRTTDERRLTEVAEGDSLIDRQRSFADFVRSNGIPCGIKPESVISALNWLVVAPKEVEWLRMRADVNGEEFKKIKRGSLRIFYQMSKEAREIIFFVYEKKGWDYRF